MLSPIPTLWTVRGCRDTHQTIVVRMAGVATTDKIRDLRQSQLNKFISVSGVVTTRTGVYPQMVKGYYNCMQCSELIGPRDTRNNKPVNINNCPNCEGLGPFKVCIQADTRSSAVTPNMLYVVVVSVMLLLCCNCCYRCCCSLQVNHGRSVYQNYQQVKVQESPNDVPAGRVPRHKTVVLMDDLIDRAKPGQQVSFAFPFCRCCE